MRALVEKLVGPAEGRERGAALVLVAFSMVTLLGMAAFGADLAWFYLNASRVQRAADAAALAGVVWLPQDEPQAHATAFDIAGRNGYDDPGNPDVTVTSTVVTGQATQLRVSVEHVVPTFFIRVLGFDSMTIRRDAIAEYVPPLKLGSPENQFGNECDPGQPGCTGQANFWANIHGKWTNTVMGDAYSSWCRSGNDNTGCPLNPNRRDTGYLYGVEAPGTFTVQFIDLAFHNTSGGNPTSDYIRTGDRGCEAWGTPAPECGPTMYVALYAPDPTPLLLDTPPVCQGQVPPQPQRVESDPYLPWLTPDAIPGYSGGTGCWTQTGLGIWVLQVRHVDPGTQNDRSGLNRYSVRAAGGSGTKLFALGDFSIYNNAEGTTTSFYLAEVPSYYNGKTFVVELYDPGESADTGLLQVIDPGGSVFTDGQCRIYSSPSVDPDYSLQQTIPAGSPCQESVSPQEYNGRWLKFEMDLPPEYTCGADCWWKMNYSYPSAMNDTTTWRAYMIGNPIHLIE